MNQASRSASVSVRLAVCALVAIACALPACGPAGPTMGKVSGKVTYKGQPLEKGIIGFVPDDPNGQNANGIIANGTYIVQTVEPGDGAVVGSYKVTISGKDPAEINNPLPGAPTQVKSAIPEKYEEATKSGLTATVKGGSNTIDFSLTD